MDAASLYDSLRTRLDHLEAKLEAHRQELLDEFHQHYHQLTRSSDPSVFATIQDRLRGTLDHYIILRPSLPPPHPPSPPQPIATPAAESPRPPVSEKPDTDGHTATTSQTLSLASTPADSGNLDPPRSPRDRDHELRGLFTPSYLPLLVDSHITADNTPVVTTTAAASSSQQPSVVAGSPNNADTGWLPATANPIANSTTSAEMHQSAEEDRFPGRLTTPPRQRPSESEPAEAATPNDANSPTSSDKGDNKAPRSAMRRDSSMNKSPQSPRRVRFDLKGAEVLPTASPQPGDTMMPSLPSPLWEGENVTVDSILGGDDDDLEPPPFKKISSSDALRALSRAPLEDGTIWTVVNPDLDDIVTDKMQQVDLGKPLANPESGMQQIRQEVGNDAKASGSGSLDLKKTRVATPPLRKSPVMAPLNDSDVGDLGDDMFEFEDENGRTSSSQLPPSSADEGEQSEDEQSEDEQSEGEDAAVTFASVNELTTLRSPTTVAPAPMPSIKPEVPAPATPTTPRFHVGSVGSYKGRSIMMPVVKDPEVHAKAASIGNFNSFVGGLDGTSGMDAADLSSYRASFMRGGFSGTPRSFTERLMMEDMEADRLNEKLDEQ